MRASPEAIGHALLQFGIKQLVWALSFFTVIEVSRKHTCSLSVSNQRVGREWLSFFGVVTQQ